jgi:hypothetical protein
VWEAWWIFCFVDVRLCLLAEYEGVKLMWSSTGEISVFVLAEWNERVQSTGK